MKSKRPAFDERASMAMPSARSTPNRRRLCVAMLATIAALSLACAAQRTGPLSATRSPTIVGFERVAFAGTIDAIRTQTPVPARWASSGEDHWTLRANAPHEASVRLSVRDGELVIRWQHADDAADDVRAELRRVVRAAQVLAVALSVPVAAPRAPEPPTTVLAEPTAPAITTNQPRRRTPR